MAELTPTERFQALRERWLNLLMTTDPATLPSFFTSNEFVRSLAYLIGKGESDAIPLTCTEGGRLKVASLPGGFTHNDVTDDNAVADAYTEFEFADICQRVDIWVEDNGVTIKRRPTAVTAYEDEIDLPAEFFYSFDCDCQAISYKNETPGSTAKIQMVGWY